MQLALGLADVHVEDVGDGDVEEAGAALAGGGAGEQLLAAAGRPVEQDAAAHPLLEALEERRLLEGPDDAPPDLLLDLVEAAHRREGDRLDLGHQQPRHRQLVGVVVGDHPQARPVLARGEGTHGAGEPGPQLDVFEGGVLRDRRLVARPPLGVAVEGEQRARGEHLCLRQRWPVG